MPGIPRTDPGPLPVVTAYNVSRQVMVARSVQWAGTSQARRRGLLDHTTFEGSVGLYLVPCPWIHTFGMAFPIDVAYLDGDGRVLSIQEELPPNRLPLPRFRAAGTLELPASSLRESGTQVGDVIRFEALSVAD